MSISLSVLWDLPKPTRFLGECAEGNGCELWVGRPFGRLFLLGAEVGKAVLCEVNAADAPLRTRSNG